MAIAESPSVQAPQTNRETITVKNPAFGDVIGEVLVSTSEEVKDAVDRARIAQVTWGKMSIKERAKIFRRWLDILWERQAEGVRVIHREAGKVEQNALIELLQIDNVGSYYVTHAERILKPSRRNALLPIVQRAKVIHKPYGVVGVISPWNYPLALPFMDSIAPLMAGNTVVLKPSEITPLTAQWALDLLYEAGLPRDVMQIVNGYGATGATLVEYVDYVAFTGSTATGRKVAIRCAERMIPYTLELGGKDPILVLNDANLDLAAAGVVRGAFENAGQMCMSIERVYVEEGIYDAFVERVLHHMQRLIVTNQSGMDAHIGSMINMRELERTEQHINEAVAKGAKVIFGGKRRPDLGPQFFEPTVVVNVDHSMDMMREETFGPTLPIMKIKDAEEGIRLANDSQYGLTSAVFSKNLKRAEELVSRIDTGDAAVNRTPFVVGCPDLPSGGRRNSGTGRRNGPEGLLKYTYTQSVLVDSMVGMTDDLGLVDPIALFAFKTLRVIRRYFPYF